MLHNGTQHIILASKFIKYKFVIKCQLKIKNTANSKE